MRPGWRPSSHVYRDLVAERLFPGARVLDLGCGRGGVMEQLHPGAALTVGLDPDHRSLQEHRAPLAVARAVGRAESLPYADDVFDLACCSWVLEHLRRPAMAFAEAARVLAVGGHFVFLTPNVRHPLLMLNRALHWTRGRLVDQLYDRAEPDIFPAFYRANTPARIERLAHGVGFEIVCMWCVDDPTYLAFNEPLFRLGCLLARLTPRPMGVHLVGVCVRV